MGSKAKSWKLWPDQYYLFRERSDLTSMQQGRLGTIHFAEWQLYGVLDGKLEPIFAYASKKDDYSTYLLECIGIGEFVWIEYDNGQLSIWLQSFLKKPENREQAKIFFPRIKKQS